MIRCCRCGKVESPLLCTKRSLKSSPRAPSPEADKISVGPPTPPMAAPLRSALAVSIAEDMNPSRRRAVSCFSSCFVVFPNSSWIVLCSYVLAPDTVTTVSACANVYHSSTECVVLHLWTCGAHASICLSVFLSSRTEKERVLDGYSCLLKMFSHATLSSPMNVITLFLLHVYPPHAILNHVHIDGGRPRHCRWICRPSPPGLLCCL